MLTKGYLKGYRASLDTRYEFMTDNYGRLEQKGQFLGQLSRVSDSWYIGTEGQGNKKWEDFVAIQRKKRYRPTDERMSEVYWRVITAGNDEHGLDETRVSWSLWRATHQDTPGSLCIARKRGKLVSSWLQT